MESDMINENFQKFLNNEVRIWIDGRGGGYNGFILEDGTILSLVDHREIRGFTNYLEQKYGITTTEWEKTHDWITSIYTESKWFEDNANAIRVSEEHSTIELLSTQNPTQKQWKTIKEMCESDKIIVEIADIRNKATEHTIYGHVLYQVSMFASDRVTKKVAIIKDSLRFIKTHPNCSYSDWYHHQNCHRVGKC